MGKEVRVGFRLSLEEKRLLEEKANKESLKLSQYLRNMVRNTVRIFTISKTQSESLEKEFTNLAKLGTNIHQITRKLNYRYRDNEKGEQDYYLISEKEIKLLQADLADTRKVLLELKVQLGQFCKMHRMD